MTLAALLFWILFILLGPDVAVAQPAAPAAAKASASASNRQQATVQTTPPPEVAPALARANSSAPASDPERRPGTAFDLRTFLELGIAAVAAIFTAWAAFSARRAAMISKEAIVGLDRPYLMVNAPICQEKEEPGFWGPTFEARNFGRSPAIASKLSESLAVHPSKGEPVMPAELRERELAGIFIASDGAYPLASERSVQLQKSSSIEGDHRLIWMGRLDYTDLLGHGYLSSFCYERTADGGWIMTGGKALNQSIRVDD